MKNINAIKKEDLFKKLTKKDDVYIEYLRDRIGSHISTDIANAMLQFALSKEQSILIQDKIAQDCFYKKKPVQNPTAHIVISQAGGGKTQVTKMLLKDNPNIVFIDSDVFKKYNPLKKLILKNCPTYFGHLTGLDCYLHRDYIYDQAINNKYNILIELTPSTKQGLFNIDIASLQKKGYKVVVHILAVSLINSLLSIHERYEQQLEQKYEMPKLTDLKRAVDSYNATEIIFNKLKTNNKIDIKLYKRNSKKIGAIKICCKNKDYLKTFKETQNKDYLLTLKNTQKRIININYKMQQRNAPLEQIKQFENIVEIIKNKYN